MESRPTWNLSQQMVNTLNGLIWKPIPLVLTKWKHVIDIHRKIYSINYVYKPRIHILLTFEQVLFYCSKWGIPVYNALYAPSFSVHSCLYLNLDIIHNQLQLKLKILCTFIAQASGYYNCLKSVIHVGEQQKIPNNNKWWFYLFLGTE